MARYQIILAYDGTHFKGYQRQARARTVQGVVEDALRSLGWNGRTILSAGRTDTGVHAAGQVIAFELDWAPHTPVELLQALNANLPEDVAAREVREAAEDFHPRYSARARCYRYRLFCQEVRDPLRERYAWRVWPAVDESLLDDAARVLTGAHDFAAFGSPPKAGGSTLRTIYSARWERSGDELAFEVTGNAFLYRMVRRLVFVQVQVGQGRLAVRELEHAMIEPAALIPGLAPARGLALMEVRDDPIGIVNDPIGSSDPALAAPFEAIEQRQDFADGSLNNT